MTNATWLPDVLRSANLKVSLLDGWETRGRAEMKEVLGVLGHHTAGPKTGNAPSLTTVLRGRSDLPGPLAQLVLGRDGTYYVVAAGLANHAGKGSWQGVTAGNSHFIGIEAENTGLADDPWPDIQVEAYAAGAAAILSHVGASPIMFAGHKEYALPKGRKIDPTLDMVAMRLRVAALMNGAAPRPLTPKVDAKSRRTIRRGDEGDDVADLQRAIGVDADKKFGNKTEAALRVWQRAHGLKVADGIAGPATWAAVDALSTVKTGA